LKTIEKRLIITTPGTTRHSGSAS